jgi:hypothetical protein
VGMDLLGYLVKGPVQLDPAKVAEAKVRVGAVYEAYLAEQARLDETEEDYPEKWPDGLPPLDEDFEEIEGAWDRLRETFDSRSAEEVVQDFLDFWPENARDTVARPDPDDPSQAVVFAGEGSWGDEPSGWGYRNLHAAYMLGILEPLGIR